MLANWRLRREQIRHDNLSALAMLKAPRTFMNMPHSKTPDAKKTNVSIVRVGLDSAYLAKVISQHAARKARLGQFPMGAF